MLCNQPRSFRLKVVSESRRRREEVGVEVLLTDSVYPSSGSQEFNRFIRGLKVSKHGLEMDSDKHSRGAHSVPHYYEDDLRR